MTKLRFILGDQLSQDISSLHDANPATDVVLMVEVAEETSYVPHHKQKIAFVLACMRHFAEDLRMRGFQVDYVMLDDPANTGSFTQELTRAVANHQPKQVVVTEPGEYRVLQALKDWSSTSTVPLDVREDSRFYCSQTEFAQWANRRKSYRMEAFYQTMRKRTGILMEGDYPVGGRWNYDAANRKPWPADRPAPERLEFKPDQITREVLMLVANHFADHFGNLEPFNWAVTRAQALDALEDFVTVCLPAFGDYQDAMRAGEPFLYHAILSPYLNNGLLAPQEVIERALTDYDAGHVPLNAIEGFVRQILGWREFIRGIYWLRMPDYPHSNALNAKRSLPSLYWTGNTDMNCMRHAIEDTRQHAYAHHINRLMITGNFALLAGITPAEIEEWYLCVYLDAYEWVELPNVHGMAIFADGGLMASKPYAGGGAYIQRMSNYCDGCKYSPKIKDGPRACPFNYLYWAFLLRNQDVLRGNPRLAMPYQTIAKWDSYRRIAILDQAEQFLDNLPTNY